MSTSLMLRLTLLLVLLLGGSFRAAQAQAMPRVKPVTSLLLVPIPAQLPSILDILSSHPRCLDGLYYSHSRIAKQQAVENEEGTATERRQVRFLLTK